MGRMGLDGDELMDSEHREYMRLDGYEDWYSAPSNEEGGGDPVFWWSCAAMVLVAGILFGMLWARGDGE